MAAAAPRPQAWPARLEGYCAALARRVAVVGVAGMLVLSLLTIADICLRYFLTEPILGLDEATQLIMAVVISASFPIGIATRNHITIDFLRNALGRRTKSVVEAIGGAMVLALMILLAWRFGQYASRLMERQEATLIANLPVAPFWWMVTGFLTLGAAMQAVVLLNQLIEALRPDRDVRPGAASGTRLVIACLAATVLLYAAMIEWGVALGPVTLAAVAFTALWLPVLIMVPVSVAMAACGLVGGSVLTNFDAAANTLVIHSAAFLSNLNLVVLPLFLMKGSFATAAGLSNDAYRLAHALLGHRRGGLAMATIGSCAGFGAVSGSSLATAATIGSVALPEMRKRGYSVELATGCVAAGGTLGSLIPPSGIMVIYAILTESSIGKIFIAAIVPAVLATCLYLITIAIYVHFKPSAAGPVDRTGRRDVLAALINSWGVVVLFGSVIGGIYLGVFTATEAGAVGAGGAFLFALARGRLSGASFWRVMGEVAMNTAMIYMLLFGAVIFSFFIGVSQLPQTLVAAIQAAHLPPFAVIVLLLVVYLLLGFVMDPITTLFVTVPVVAPLIASLGYDPVWWGIVTIVVIELGLIHPPFGLNAFIIKGVAGPDVALGTIFRGIVPFLVSDFVKLALLVLFPFLTLWLPSTIR
ncbi:MAG TPA: TRAP transporter large permease subunit [Stellaceae bacterium]|nr:TRAP transporter large permease subunit [Stellaceae bacterium]